MDISRIKNSLHTDHGFTFKAALVFFIFWGFINKLLISLNLSLESDSVGMGLLSMEIGKHHNLFLSGYHLMAADNLIFTELPFQILPQIVTQYHPLALKMVIFFIFILSVLTLSFLAWDVTGNMVSALLFAALAANIPVKGYVYLAYPTNHNATILFSAAILLIFFILDRYFQDGRAWGTKSVQRCLIPFHARPFVCFIVLEILVFLSVFSDTLILIWVIIPVIISTLLLTRGTSHRMNAVIITTVVVSLIAYIIKNYFFDGWIKTFYGLNDIATVVSINIPLFFKILLRFLNYGGSELLEKTASVGFLEGLSLLLFTGVLFFSVSTCWKTRGSITRELRLLNTIILFSVVLIAGAFFISGYVADIHAARYLTFTALILVLAIAVTVPANEKVPAFLILALLFVSALSCSLTLATMDQHPNEREYHLIDYLKGHNLTAGYGTYWSSNVVTYLSGESVVIRSTFYAPPLLKQQLINSCDRWYTASPRGRIFFIYDTKRPFDQVQENFLSFIDSTNRTEVLHYHDYDIYPVTIKGPGG